MPEPTAMLAGRAIAELVDFNRFQRWADMLLGDFNDVDMYMVDPAELFPNLERYREISANYVSPEVLEEIRRHWHIDRIPEFGDSFWNHKILSVLTTSASGCGKPDCIIPGWLMPKLAVISAPHPGAASLTGATFS